MRISKIVEEFSLTQEQEDFLDECVIGRWKLNSDGTVDVDGDFMRVDKGWIESGILPVRFRKVTGEFTIMSAKLTSLKGFPEEVGKTFQIYGNILKNLVGMPQKIGGMVLLYSNELESLEGCIQDVNLGFKVNDNKLHSLKHGPKKVTGPYTASNNLIESIKDLSGVIIDGDLHLQDNAIENLEGFPTVGADVDLSRNQIKSFKGIQKSIKGKLKVTDNQIETFEDCPIDIGGNFDIKNNNLKTLVNNIKSVNDTIYLQGNPYIKNGGLGLLKIDGLKRVFLPDLIQFKELSLALNNNAGQGRKGLLAAQTAIMASKYEEFADM